MAATVRWQLGLAQTRSPSAPPLFIAVAVVGRLIYTVNSQSARRPAKALVAGLVVVAAAARTTVVFSSSAVARREMGRHAQRPL